MYLCLISEGLVLHTIHTLQMVECYAMLSLHISASVCVLGMYKDGGIMRFYTGPTSALLFAYFLA